MTPEANKVICIGGVAVDRKYRSRARVRFETSNPVTSERSFGGVARNVAENIAHLGLKADLVSIVGDDENGRSVLRYLGDLRIGTRHVMISREHATAEYVAVLQPNGDLAVGLADMTILDTLTPDRLHDAWPDLPSAGWVFADCNLPPQTLQEITRQGRQHLFQLAIDTVSTPKAVRLPHDLRGIGLLFINIDEALALLGLGEAFSSSPTSVAAALLQRGAERVVLTLGADGLIAADRTHTARIGAFGAEVVDATGAGDALIAATLAAMLSGSSFVDSARLGAVAAALTIENRASVRADLSLTLLEASLSGTTNPFIERTYYESGCD